MFGVALPLVWWLVFLAMCVCAVGLGVLVAREERRRKRDQRNSRMRATFDAYSAMLKEHYSQDDALRIRRRARRQPRFGEIQKAEHSETRERRDTPFRYPRVRTLDTDPPEAA